MPEIDPFLPKLTRLSALVPNYVRDDPRANAIAVRHILSHSSGLPNWRTVDLPLKTYFPPAERFSYSGEGFVWLQRVVVETCVPCRETLAHHPDAPDRLDARRRGVGLLECDRKRGCHVHYTGSPGRL